MWLYWRFLSDVTIWKLKSIGCVEYLKKFNGKSRPYYSSIQKAYCKFVLQLAETLRQDWILSYLAKAVIAYQSRWCPWNITEKEIRGRSNPSVVVMSCLFRCLWIHYYEDFLPENSWARILRNIASLKESKEWKSEFMKPDFQFSFDTNNNNIIITSLSSLCLLISYTKETTISQNPFNPTRICCAYVIISVRFDDTEFSTNIVHIPVILLVIDLGSQLLTTFLVLMADWSRSL